MPVETGGFGKIHHMPSLNDDLAYLKFATEVLEDYLLSGDIFWPISGGHTGHLPRLTLGGILLAETRSKARAKSGPQQTQLRHLQTAMEATRTRWHVAWERKAGQEFEVRLRQWAAFFNDYRQDAANQAAYYAYEVRLRVMLDLLLNQVGQNITPAALEMYHGLDAMLQAVFEPGDFVWETDLQDSFPKDKFYYLYGQLRKK